MLSDCRIFVAFANLAMLQFGLVTQLGRLASHFCSPSRGTVGVGSRI